MRKYRLLMMPLISSFLLSCSNVVQSNVDENLGAKLNFNVGMNSWYYINHTFIETGNHFSGYNKNITSGYIYGNIDTKNICFNVHKAYLNHILNDDSTMYDNKSFIYRECKTIFDQNGLYSEIVGRNYFNDLIKVKVGNRDIKKFKIKINSLICFDENSKVDYEFTDKDYIGLKIHNNEFQKNNDFYIEKNQIDKNKGIVINEMNLCKDNKILYNTSFFMHQVMDETIKFKNSLTEPNLILSKTLYEEEVEISLLNIDSYYNKLFVETHEYMGGKPC